MAEEEKKQPEGETNTSGADTRTSSYEEQDRGQEIGVEDSFPASDPPAANVFD